MAEAINYSDTVTPALLNAFLKGDGSGTTTTTTGGGQVDPAMMAQLQQILAGLGGGGTVTAEGIPQVSNQISPEQLAAIFSQGAQQIPNLTAAFANAAGARSNTNSGLQLALTDLNEGLTRQAALLGQEQQKLSTDAAYKNSSMGLQAADINARMQAARMNAEAQMATQMAALNRQPSTQTAVSRNDSGTDPMTLMLGGFALNQANKPNGWLERIFGRPTQDGSAVPVSDASAAWTAPEMAATPSMDTNFSAAWDLPSMSYSQDWLTPDFGSWGTIDAPAVNYGGGWGDSFIDGSSWEVPSFDMGNYGNTDSFNFENWSSGFSEPSYDYNYGEDINFFGDSFFADGGMPARRNQANMGAQETRMLTGVGNRDPQMRPGLIAPIRFAPAPQRQVPQQSMAKMPTQMRPQQQPQQRKERELAESPGDANVAFGPGDPTMTSAVKNLLGINSMLGKVGEGVPGLGTVAGLVNAKDRDQALGSMGMGLLGLMNPWAGLAGMIAKPLITRMMQDSDAQKAAKAAAAAAAAPKPATPAPAVTPAAGATQSSPGLVGQDAGFSGGWQSGGSGGYNGSSMNTNTGALTGGFGSNRESSFNSDGSRNNNTSTGYGGGWGGSFSAGRFADGGMPGGQIQGPGTGTSDSIQTPMANVSNGEYIVSADVVQAMGPQFFDALQAAFHKGGKPA